jgi:hypothetical protein
MSRGLGSYPRALNTSGSYWCQTCGAMEESVGCPPGWYRLNLGGPDVRSQPSDMRLGLYCSKTCLTVELFRSYGLHEAEVHAWLAGAV